MDRASNPAKYQAETGLSINGKVTNLFGKPISKAAVALIPVEYKGLLSDTTDNDGEFHFNNLAFTDSARFVLQAVNKRGKNTTKLIFNKDQPVLYASSIQTSFFPGTPDMSAYLNNTRKRQEADLKYEFGKTRHLKEVKIKAVKKDNDYPSSSIGGAGHADQVVHAEELEKTGGPLSIKLAGKFHGPYGWDITAGHFKGLIIVDGAQLYQPNPKALPIGLDEAVGDADNVETVELFYGANAAIYGMNGARGVLVITTKSGAALQPKDIPSLGVLPITAQGFYKAREFYSPKYDVPLAANSRPDLRSTIYWNRAIVTDKNGSASFEFYNADAPGNYRVVVEGMDNKGDIGRKVVYVKVGL
jgi:hypothetical protein